MARYDTLSPAAACPSRGRVAAHPPTLPVIAVGLRGWTGMRRLDGRTGAGQARARALQWRRPHRDLRLARSRPTVHTQARQICLELEWARRLAGLSCDKVGLASAVDVIGGAAGLLTFFGRQAVPAHPVVGAVLRALPAQETQPARRRCPLEVRYLRSRARVCVLCAGRLCTAACLGHGPRESAGRVLLGCACRASGWNGLERRREGTNVPLC